MLRPTAGKHELHPTRTYRSLKLRFLAYIPYIYIFLYIYIYYYYYYSHYINIYVYIYVYLRKTHTLI